MTKTAAVAPIIAHAFSILDSPVSIADRRFIWLFSLCCIDPDGDLFGCEDSVAVESTRQFFEFRSCFCSRLDDLDPGGLERIKNGVSPLKPFAVRRRGLPHAFIHHDAFFISQGLIPIFRSDRDPR